ncbi:NYN domain-containing protein [Amycolatopsis acidicola]|uniref:NYN domain-containing protein n=1 Tax=Amycolatopsis acidicola TaxID=2596893 RepID=A0A5N0VHQ4_9PSEU|nr:NYN domain-containing protein [Amycolatopsis acidicola]KAA9164963.1 NYN domain-containing protein [Amycolatopsis acidicola]
MGVLRVCLVIDYQNIHLTAHDLFAPNGTAVEDCLIDPLRFAEQVVAVRSRNQRDERQKDASVTAVRVFRGQPSNHRQSFVYGISQRQRSEWTRDRRVTVTYRPLRYPPNWPTDPAQEKGVDVLTALTLVRAAASGDYDVAILASHDTDLEPALDMAASDGRCKIETCGWQGARVLRLGNGRRLWHTALSGADMVATRDRRDYLPPNGLKRNGF